MGTNLVDRNGTSNILFVGVDEQNGVGGVNFFKKPV